MNYLVKAIKLLKPDSEFSFTDDDYLTVKWDILEGLAPTLAEIEAEIVKIKADAEQAAAEKAEAKAAIAERLGITQDELALLLA